MLTATVSWWVPVVYIPNWPTPSHSLYLNMFQRYAKGSEKRKEGLNHLAALLPCCSFPHQAFCALLGELWTASAPFLPSALLGYKTWPPLPCAWDRYVQKKAFCNLPSTPRIISKHAFESNFCFWYKGSSATTSCFSWDGHPTSPNLVGNPKTS